MVSVIVPVYNDEYRLKKCLESVFDSDCPDIEVIVVDDGSTDGSLAAAKEFPCKVVGLKKNAGVANARNEGAKIARGELLVFFDSDIVVEKDTVSNFAKLHKDPAIRISSCQVYPESLSGGFTADVLAVDWAYIYKTIEKSATYIPSMNFAIAKDVFDQLGGFNTAFGQAGGEEIEMGMQAIRMGYKIYVDQSFRVRHNFQRFWPRCRTLFRRGYLYGRIVLQRNLSPDKGHGTFKEAANSALSLAGVAALVLTPVFPRLFQLFLSTLAAQMLLDLGLNMYTLRQKGLMFLLGAVPLRYMWYFVMGLSIIRAVAAHYYEMITSGGKGTMFVRLPDGRGR